MGCQEGAKAPDLCVLEKAAYFGRPLFANIQDSHRFCNDSCRESVEQIITEEEKSELKINGQLFKILERMIFSLHDDWMEDDKGPFWTLGDPYSDGLFEFAFVDFRFGSAIIR